MTVKPYSKDNEAWTFGVRGQWLDKLDTIAKDNVRFARPLPRTCISAARRRRRPEESHGTDGARPVPIGCLDIKLAGGNTVVIHDTTGEVAAFVKERLSTALHASVDRGDRCQRKSRGFFRSNPAAFKAVTGDVDLENRIPHHLPAEPRSARNLILVN